jgi:hypothetical protein
MADSELVCDLFMLNEIVGNVHSARGHQDGAPNGDAACDCKTVN